VLLYGTRLADVHSVESLFNFCDCGLFALPHEAGRNRMFYEHQKMIGMAESVL
jgi:hypothetical protein